MWVLIGETWAIPLRSSPYGSWPRRLGRNLGGLGQAGLCQGALGMASIIPPEGGLDKVCHNGAGLGVALKVPPERALSLMALGTHALDT